ncbi:hypothetical protein [Pandoraea apista]|uniref:Uncharacterized protein n=1 Tax=Pandoraea apista TaxID=93218 RepID=A0ABX9ZS76_9BURK|nr:hypothetical protein [Pandoraea apista]PTE02187.1 hypothetical protein C7830_04740 [Pandoraea apista]RRJ34626.1 hypothetical protein EIB05_02655 [Pandoraea apista]RRJ80752.1 hypothetical protein EIL82_06960 [Pandoraea apista]RSD16981.1 hypothetical protein EIZ52_14175 [Pandoraea apista]RSD17385.1 hypothetical protein EJB12_04020 [Pandoraea apista]
MRPINNASFAPTTNPGQSYLAIAAQGRLSDSITEAEAGIAALLAMQNATIARLDRLAALQDARPLNRATSADNAQSRLRRESMKSDMTRCQSCGNLETITTRL